MCPKHNFTFSYYVQSGLSEYGQCGVTRLDYPTPLLALFNASWWGMIDINEDFSIVLLEFSEA